MHDEQRLLSPIQSYITLVIMVIGACTIELELPGVASLKEKRSMLKTLIARLHREFNISAAEVDLQDEWAATVLGISSVSNDAAHAQRWLQHVIEWIEKYRPDVEVVDHYIEIIHFSSTSR